MGIILRESAYSHEPVQDSGPLIAVDGSQFGITKREVTIAPQMGLVDHDVVRTIHGFELVLLPSSFIGGNMFAVVLEMSAGFPQIKASGMG